MYINAAVPRPPRHRSYLSILSVVTHNWHITSLSKYMPGYVFATSCKFEREGGAGQSQNILKEQQQTREIKVNYTQT